MMLTAAAKFEAIEPNAKSGAVAAAVTQRRYENLGRR